MGRLLNEDSERLGLSPQVRTVHQASPVVDLHVDCIIQQRLFGYDIAKAHDPHACWHWRSLKYDILRAACRLAGNHQPLFNHVDIPRMLRGGYSCAAMTLHYWPKQSEHGWAEINRQLDYLGRVVEQHDRVVWARDPDDVRQAHHRGQLALFPVVEGLHCLGEGGRSTQTTRLDRIETLYRRGVRYITLAHFCRNDAVTHGFGPRSNQNDRLTDFGREVVGKMNEVGMIVDVAHVNHPCVMDVCACSDKPVIASHSGLASMEPRQRPKHRSRLLRDDALLAIARTGGTVGIIFAPVYLSGKRGGLEWVSRHIRYGIEKIEADLDDGAQYFSIGSDFDGWLSTIPAEMKDAADLPLLTQQLLEEGLEEPQVKGILGENFLRVWSATLG